MSQSLCGAMAGHDQQRVHRISEQAELSGIVTSSRIPEANREIDPILFQEWHALNLETVRHDLGMPECPTAAQPAFAVNNPVTGQV